MPQPGEDAGVWRERAARSYLNYSKLNELEANLRILTPFQQDLLLTTQNRIAMYPQRFARQGQDYAQTAGIILMSEFERRKDFCMCGVCGRACKLWRICPACGHRKRMTILKKFLPVFRRGNYFFLTASFDDYMPYDFPGHALWHVHWAAIEYAVRTMVADGYFEGAFVYEALYIESFFPKPLILPHAHILVVAEELTAGTLGIFRQRVSEFNGHVWNRKRRAYELPAPEWRESIAVTPNTCTHHIDGIEDAANVMGYLVKPEDVTTPYLADWARYVADDRSQAILLNQNVNEVLAGWEVYSHDRDGHYYRGRLHHSSGDFLGIPRRIRETRRHDREVRDLLARCNELNFEAFPHQEHVPIEREARQAEAGEGGE
jgi:hypothetical protein